MHVQRPVFRAVLVAGSIGLLLLVRTEAQLSADRPNDPGADPAIGEAERTTLFDGDPDAVQLTEAFHAFIDRDPAGARAALGRITRSPDAGGLLLGERLATVGLALSNSHLRLEAAEAAQLAVEEIEQELRSDRSISKEMRICVLLTKARLLRDLLGDRDGARSVFADVLALDSGEPSARRALDRLEAIEAEAESKARMNDIIRERYEQERAAGLH